jgi:hypothetical protein
MDLPFNHSDWTIDRHRPSPAIGSLAPGGPDTMTVLAEPKAVVPVKPELRVVGQLADVVYLFGGGVAADLPTVGAQWVLRYEVIPELAPGAVIATLGGRRPLLVSRPTMATRTDAGNDSSATTDMRRGMRHMLSHFTWRGVFTFVLRPGFGARIVTAGLVRIVINTSALLERRARSAPEPAAG